MTPGHTADGKAIQMTYALIIRTAGTVVVVDKDIEGRNVMLVVTRLGNTRAGQCTPHFDTLPSEKPKRPVMNTIELLCRLRCINAHV